MTFNPTFSAASLFSSGDGANGAPSDLIQYLLQVEPLFSSLSPSLRREPEHEPRDEAVSDEERQNLFLNNVLAEITGHEPSVSMHHDGSRVFEKFIFCCQAHDQAPLLTAVCRALEPVLGQLAVDRFGSHVLQALLKAVRPLIEREVLDGEAQRESSLVVWTESASRTLLLDGSPGAASPFMTNEYGSHVLRSLLITLVGRDLYCQIEEEGHAMSGNKYTAQRKDSAERWVYKIPAERFSGLLARFTDALGTASVETLKGWAFHQSASPILQFLLMRYSVERGADCSSDRLLHTLFSDLAMDASFFWKASSHKIASHFLQSLLRAMGRCSPKSYHLLYSTVVRTSSSLDRGEAEARAKANGLETLLLDPNGNYVLQSLVEHAPSQEFLHLLLDHLQAIQIRASPGPAQATRRRTRGLRQAPNEAEPHARPTLTFSDLIALGRFGLFVKAIQASIRLQCIVELQGLVVKLCLSMLKETSSDKLLPCLLSLNKQTTASATPAHFEYMGCLASTLLITHYDPQSIKPLIDSVLKSCTHDYLFSMATSAYASFTLESILRRLNAKIRSKLIFRLLLSRKGEELEESMSGCDQHEHETGTQDVFWRLAVDKHGSHILQAIYKLSTVEEKGRWNDRLLPYRSMLQDKGGLVGRMTLQFTRLADYARRRDDWQATEQERQAKERRAASLLDSVDLSLLTGEALASSAALEDTASLKRKKKRTELDEVDRIFQSVHGKKSKKHAA